MMDDINIVEQKLFELSELIIQALDQKEHTQIYDISHQLIDIGMPYFSRLSAKNKTEIIKAFNNMAYFYHQNNDESTAFKFYFKGAELGQEYFHALTVLGQEVSLLCSQQVGGFYFKNKELDKSLAVYEQTVELALLAYTDLPINARYTLYNSYLAISEILLEQGKPEYALKNLKSVIDRFIPHFHDCSNEEKTWQLHCIYLSGNSALSLNQLHSAANFLTIGIQLGSSYFAGLEPAAQLFMLDFYRGMAFIANHQQRLDQAIDYAQQGLKLAYPKFATLNLDCKVSALENLQSLSYFSKQQDNPSQAVHYSTELLNLALPYLVNNELNERAVGLVQYSLNTLAEHDAPIPSGYENVIFTPAHTEAPPEQVQAATPESEIISDHNDAQAQEFHPQQDQDEQTFKDNAEVTFNDHTHEVDSPESVGDVYNTQNEQQAANPTHETTALLNNIDTLKQRIAQLEAEAQALKANNSPTTITTPSVPQDAQTPNPLSEQEQLELLLSNIAQQETQLPRMRLGDREQLILMYIEAGHLAISLRNHPEALKLQNRCIELYTPQMKNLSPHGQTNMVMCYKTIIDIYNCQQNAKSVMEWSDKLIKFASPYFEYMTPKGQQYLIEVYYYLASRYASSPKTQQQAFSLFKTALAFSDDFHVEFDEQTLETIRKCEQSFETLHKQLNSKKSGFLGKLSFGTKR